MKTNDAPAGLPITLDDLSKVPFLDLKELGDRTVNMLPLWDGTRWSLWMPTEKGLFEMHPVDTYKYAYVAAEPAKASDLLIPFVDLMWQRASWPEMGRLVGAIESDFHNLATSLEKIDRFYLSRKEIGMGVADFVATELEYILVVSRSIFDLLQKVIGKLWSGKRIKLLDEKANKKRKERVLPPSFQEMLEKGSADGRTRLRTKEDFIEDFALSDSLADAYLTVAKFFNEIRAFRNKIVHGVAEPGVMFVTDRGFCVSKNYAASVGINYRIADSFDNENLVSLLPLLAHIVVGTIDCCSLLATSFAAQIVLAEELAPGYRVFLRGPHNDALVWVAEVAKGASPWWSDRVRVPKVEPPQGPVAPVYSTTA